MTTGTKGVPAVLRRRRRVLAAAIAFLVLCVVLPAAGEDADALRAFLQDHYDLTILMGSECASFTLENHELLIKPEGETPFLKMIAGNNRFVPLLRMMDDVFSVYPPEFFSHFRAKKYPDGLRFLLVDEITSEGIPFGGVQTIENKALDIILSRDGVDGSSVHHEIWHAMEVRIRLDNSRAFNKWRNLNPKGFAYSRVNSALAAGGQYEEPDDWFAREYSKTYEEEDRATVYEAMMTKDEDWWSTRPNLQKKAEFLLGVIRPVFGELFAGE